MTNDGAKLQPVATSTGRFVAQINGRNSNMTHLLLTDCLGCFCCCFCCCNIQIHRVLQLDRLQTSVLQLHAVAYHPGPGHINFTTHWNACLGRLAFC